MHCNFMTFFGIVPLMTLALQISMGATKGRQNGNFTHSEMIWKQFVLKPREREFSETLAVSCLLESISVGLAMTPPTW